MPRPSVPSPDSTLAASEVREHRRWRGRVVTCLELMSLRPRMPAHLQLPLYTEQPLDHNHGHEAPRLPQRGSWMSRMLVGVVVMLCCGLMVLCIALAVAVGGYKIEQRGGGLLDGTPLFAHAHLTVDTAASPPPPARELLRLPSRIANQLHRIRQIEILDGQLDEASLRRVFPHWWDTDGALQSAVAMADVVTALAHLSLLLSPITESES